MLNYSGRCISLRSGDIKEYYIVTFNIVGNKGESMRVKKCVALIIFLSLILSLLSGLIQQKNVFAEEITYTRTYTKMTEYNYGDKNNGFYMVPDEPGQYPVIFMFHGAGKEVSGNWEYKANILDTVNKWIALGYMDPMVIVVPNIERENEKDDWSLHGFNKYVNNGRFKALLDKIKNSEMEFDDKVDHSKKFSVTGFSMGGVESLFIGTRYKNDILNIGACSPSYMYYHVTGDNDDGWVKKADVNFTDDPNAHFMMGYGTKEDAFFHESVERYIAAYKENKTEEQKVFVVYGSYPDGHTWATFSREIFCFIYYMKFDVLPDDETIEKACKDKNLNYKDTSGNGSNNSSGNGSSSTSGGSGKGSKDTTGTNPSPKYSTEWINGKWYDANGTHTYEHILSWKCNDKGWWIEDSSGWYAVSCWQKIDGLWYYFDELGYMASDEWRDGWRLSSDGSQTYKEEGSWHASGNKWWFGDASGWYASATWQKINGSWYYFDDSGYMVTNQYVNGYWLGADGVCQ